jgi:hypothetical protein
MQAPSGRTLVYFDLGISETGRRQRSASIEGTLKWCDGSGAVLDYGLYGDVDNWRGTRFHLTTRYLVERESGQSPAELQGEWQGDEIKAAGRLVRNERTATAVAVRGQPIQQNSTMPVEYTLRRGSEKDFLKACRDRTSTSGRN